VGSTGAGITIKQAGAGWSKPFSASTKAVFRPAAGNRRFLRVVNAIGADTLARGYEDMTDVDTGTGPFPTVAQVATPIVVGNVGYSSQAGSPWFLIATSKWMIFQLANLVTPAYSVSMLFFGDASHTVVPNDPYSSMLRINSAIYLCRNYAGAAGSVAASVRDSDGGSAAWPSVIADGAQFLPYATVVESTSILRGVMPNAYKVYPIIPANKFSDIYSNISGNGSRMKAIPSAATATMPMVIAIDEEAWD
jgi:hypothetical protein